MHYYIVSDELYHHGVLGMKWGVRRYQNADGSYTRAGMARYNKSSDRYNAARKKVKAAKVAYKSGNGSKIDVNAAKTEKRIAKRKLNRDYKQLKRDRMADKGKELYSSGKTITDNNSSTARARQMLAVGGVLAGQYIKRYANSRGAVLITKHGTIPVSSIAGDLVSVGSAAVAGMLEVKAASENRKLRAYYGHSRPKD